MHRIWLPALLAGLTAMAYAQDGVHRLSTPPYSADEVTEHVQTLADGTHITHTSTGKVYRDSEGRTRTERPMANPGADGADAPVSIEIIDPVARVTYRMNTQEKIAHKHSMPAPEPRPSAGAVLSHHSHPMIPAAPSPAAEADHPSTTEEKLGTQMIEGMLATGTRRTVVWPAGSRRGNDQPITAVNETWTSRDLKVVLLSKQSDPQNGDTTRRLTNISRDEPDPSLFQPPADYTVKNDDRGEN